MNFIGKTFGTFLSCNMQYVLMHLDKNSPHFTDDIFKVFCSAEKIQL